MSTMDAQLNRGSKLQISKIALYWAVLTVAFAVLWSVFLNTLQLTGLGAAFSLIVPVLLGGVAAFGFYRIHSHQTLEYDEEGFRVLRGRGKVEKHDWSEFQECSLIRDSYGKVRVRAYTERDGQYVDVDPLASGVDPYSFRDFLEARTKGATTGGEQVLRGDIFDGLEKEIHRGRASWIADLNETCRRYQISGESIPLLAKGTTRPKGFLLSKFVAFTMMPDYRVCFYASDVRGSGGEAKSHLMRLVRIIETQRDRNDIKWSWLLLFSEHEPPESVSRTVQAFGNKDLGLGVIDIDTGRMLTSPNQLGRSLGKQMRFDQLIRDLRKKRMLAS
jgi:hypothetical protein